MLERNGGWRILTRGEMAVSARALGLWLVVLLSLTVVQAQDEPPPPKRAGMQITFVPPPMEGTLSLGIYDKKGKLVRVMAREATEKDFVVGLNGLITFWDGKDDTGKVMPAGTYFARGYSVGAIDVAGEAYYGNDWMTADDSPRLQRITEMSKMIGPTGEFSFEATTANGGAVVAS